MSATVPDSTVPAKLALDVGGYSGDYWILEVGPNYDYAVVGHPSRLYLWILSRAPTLDPATTQAIVARAQNNHFDTSQLLYTDQPTNGERVASPGPVGAIPPAVSTGCTVAAPGRETSGSEWILGLFAAVAVWLARRRTVPTATYALPQVGRPPKAHGRVPPMG
jgi:MYXO-CTERM domain-containing protein